MLHSLRRFFGSSRASARFSSANLQNKARLALEQLEAREVLSVSQVYPVGATLVIAGDNAPTKAEIYQSGSNYVVQDQASGQTWSFAASSINKVVFYGGAGNDRFINDVY